MHGKRCIFMLGLLLAVLFASTALAGVGQVKPWPMRMEGWQPADARRLEADLFYTNGSILSKYHQNTGVLYQSYRGAAAKDEITNQTFTNVIIHPPKGAHYWAEAVFPHVSLYEVEDIVTDWVDTALPNRELGIGPDYGFPYYERTAAMFDYKNSALTECRPVTRFEEGWGNLFIVKWYNKAKELITVEWVMEAVEDFTIPCHDIASLYMPSVPSVADVPKQLTHPVLINPKTPYPMQFHMMGYYYETDRGNSVFAELLLRDEYNNVVPELGMPIEMYWPYPEGHSYNSGYQYQVKHYLDNIYTSFEMLDVTPTPIGLRVVSYTFSPFELTWSKPLPKTGDNAPLTLWGGLMLGAALLMGLSLRKRRA